MLAWLASPTGLRVSLAVAVLLILAGLGFSLYTYGKSVGYENGQSAQLKFDKEQFAQVLSAYQAQLAQGQEREQRALTLLAEAQTALDSANGRLAAVKAQAIQHQEQVAQVPDSDLSRDIRGKLDLHPVDDLAPFYPDELRLLDQRITAYPDLKLELDASNERMAALEQKVTALSEQVTAISEQRDAAIDYGNRVTGFYIKAYNAANKKPFILWRILTFGLYQGNHLDLPDPITLRK